MYKNLLEHPLIDANAKTKIYTITEDFQGNTVYQYDEKTALQEIIIKPQIFEDVKLLLSSEKVDVNMVSCSLKIQISNDCIKTFKDENTALKLIVEKYENEDLYQSFSQLL